MELPQELALLLSAVVGAAVTWLVVEGVKDFAAFLGRVFHVDLSAKAEMIGKALAAVAAAGAVSIVLGVVNVLLGAVPPAYWPALQAFMAFLVVMFGSMGVNALKKKLYEAKGLF